MNTSTHNTMTPESNGGLTSSVNQVLFKFDLMHLDFGDNFDEYGIEAQAIVALLEAAHSKSDTVDIVYQVFRKYFGKEILPENQFFIQASEAIWLLWQNHTQQLKK